MQNTLSKKLPSFRIQVLGCQMNYADSARLKAVLQNCWFSRSDSIEDADIVIFDTCSVRQKSEDKVFGVLNDLPKNKKIWLTWCMVQHYLKAGRITKQQIDRQEKNQKKHEIQKPFDIDTQDQFLQADGEITSIKQLPKNLQTGNFIWTVKTTDPVIIWLQEWDLEGYASFNSTEGDYLFLNHAFNPLYKKLVMKSPAVELLFRIDDVGMLPKVLQKLWYDVHPDGEVTNEYTGIIPRDSNQLLLSSSKTAYVPISVWCSQFCSYCIVPYARWLEKNRPVDQIVSEVKHHLDTGIQEIVLLWQIVNKHPHFVQILKEILPLPWLVWLRYTSPYPNYYSPELLALHETEPKLCPHIHMPLQSWSDAILKTMRRWYSIEQFTWFVDAIRALKRPADFAHPENGKIQPISITTDIIIGFCDETEQDFQGSLDMIKYANFDMIYMGIYSPRPGTYAFKNLQDAISRTEKQTRWKRMNTLLTSVSKDNNLVEVGTVREIMITAIDQTTKGIRITGYTDNMKTVVVLVEGNLSDDGQSVTKIGSPSQKILLPRIGDFTKVKITKGESLRLEGELV